MSKHKEIFEEMLSQHKELFDEFKTIHDKYSLDQKKFQEEFNEKGQEVLDIIRKFENMLCSQSEGGIYGRSDTYLFPGRVPLFCAAR